MFKDRWQFLVGDPEIFSLRSRIFHAVSIISIVALFAESVFYQFTSLHYPSLIACLVGLIQLGLYYLSRFKNQLNVAVTLSVIDISIAHIFGYIYNAGISGNTLLLSAVTIFLILLVVPKKQGLFWFLLNVVIVLSMVYWEYVQPGIIQQHYQNRSELFIDLVVSYLIVISLLYAGTIQIRGNYELQKDLADDKALKLEVLNQEKDKLFSVISHDLTAPLASVKQYLDLLHSVDLASAERISIEQDLSKSLEDAQDLLSNLLLWTKSQLQNNQILLQQVNLLQLLQPTIAMFHQTALRKDVDLVVDIDEQIELFAEPNMFQLVIRNLLSNAVKFSNAGGEIVIQARIENHNCIVSIKDNGVGIPLSIQESLFTLSIASSHGTQNEKGTGLGLVLCKDFTARQGGDIWFDSAASAGTTFNISMPVFKSA